MLVEVLGTFVFISFFGLFVCLLPCFGSTHAPRVSWGRMYIRSIFLSLCILENILLYPLIDSLPGAWPVWLSWLEHQPINQKIVCLDVEHSDFFVDVLPVFSFAKKYNAMLSLKENFNF